MTPEERRELAERLVERAAELNERSAKVMGSLGRGWANAAADLRAAAAALREDAAADLRAAAAALREDAAPNLIGVEDVMAVHGRDALADTIRERDAARAEVERLRAGIERHRRAVRNGVPGLNGTPNRDLWALLDSEGGTDLPGDLLEMAEEVSEYRRVLGDHDRLVTAARLLSGGAAT